MLSGLYLICYQVCIWIELIHIKRWIEMIFWLTIRTRLCKQLASYSLDIPIASELYATRTSFSKHAYKQAGRMHLGSQVNGTATKHRSRLYMVSSM